jgi:DNA-binding SARP family transcriptional activator
MHFGLLGPVEALRDGEPLPLAGGKPQALLALLLLNGGRSVSTERIVDDLWGANSPDSAAKMVQIMVSQLRKQLGKDVFVTQGAGYRVELAGCTLDVVEFSALAEQGRAEIPIDPVAAASTLRRALALWRGPALAGFDEPFAAFEAGRLEEARLACLEDRVDAELACGEHQALVGELTSLAGRFPLRPRLHGQLMLAFYRSDRHAEALATYRCHREQLDELGIEPAPHLRDLERRMLQQDPTLELPARLAAATGVSVEMPPWGSHGDLLERDDPIEVLARALSDASGGSGQIVLVTGEPGIGKTALVSTFLREVTLGTRVLFGTCDDLAIPRPLGPFLDLARTVSPAFAEEVSAAEAPHVFHTRLLGELARPSPTTVLVLEDIHWADDATLDTITVLGRRISSLPVVLVLTFRTGEASPAHRLHSVIGGLSSNLLVRIDLPPLSEEAVAMLAGGAADELYAATGGNPFYIRELLVSRIGDELPQSVVNAVRGRASRLDEVSRRLVDLVSVVPHRVRGSLLDRIMPNWAAAAVEPERRQLLEVTRSHVRFRHELARHAIRSSLPIAARRAFHGAVLEALLGLDPDPADVVHHAEAAGADEVVAEYARVAARRAAALGSNSEAFSHYRRAGDLADRLPRNEQAVLFEELANSARLVGQMDAAVPAIERAMET